MIITKDDVRFIFRSIIAGHFISCTNKIVILAIPQSAVVTINVVQPGSLLTKGFHILIPDICVSGYFFHNLFIKCTFRQIANFWRLFIVKFNRLASDCITNPHDLAVIGLIRHVATTHNHHLATADSNCLANRFDRFYRV